MKICTCTSLGARDENQDCALASGVILPQNDFAFNYLSARDSKIQMFAVADGIGGESGGSISSALALEILNEEMKEFLQTSQD